ncbi:MAG: TIGR00296 family protein [Candidatus Thermoplasmatota archaeon]|nr:TIGR00296 family protein [Candidatus Thermoplasmatota archaeon]
MLSNVDGINAVKFTRNIIESHVGKKNPKSCDLGPLFDQNRGVFVSLHTFPDFKLRGCIGIPEPVMPLKNALASAAKSATKDPRFNKLEANEIEKIVIEVTILTKPEIILVNSPREYKYKVKIGRDGLIVEQGFFKGLLLPQVAVEQNWDPEEFLSNTCMKAGLLPDAWLDAQTKIYKFEGQIFSEVKPKGQIREKTIDGSCY